MEIDSTLAELIFSRIDQQELVDLAVSMGCVLAPIGREKPLADFVEQWFLSNGFETRRYPVAPERHNIVAFLRGQGEGKSLIFNAHMDSDRTPEENVWITPYPERSIPTAWIEDDKVFGRTVLNDRGSMACFMIAAKALRDSGIKLAGDLIQAIVVGETDQSPVDEFQGLEYEGNGLGTNFLLQHGVVADYALVAETTNFSPVWVECGVAFFKVTVYGQAVYTPRTSRPEQIEKHPNAAVKMAYLIQKFEEWARQYEKKNSRDYSNGKVIPKASINAIRGGLPYRTAITPGICSAYIDVRFLPGKSAVEVEREFRLFIDSLGLDANVEMFNSRQGYVAENVEPLLEAVSTSYRFVTGEEPGSGSIEERSMWRDINLYNQSGIPSLTFGPTRHVMQSRAAENKYESTTDDGGKVKYFTSDDMIRAAQTYALTAMQICGVEPDPE